MQTQGSKALNINEQNHSGQTALHVHAHRGNLGCVLTLASYCANLDAQDADGNTALHIAVSVSVNPRAVVSSVKHQLYGFAREKEGWPIGDDGKGGRRVGEDSCESGGHFNCRTDSWTW